MLTKMYDRNVGKDSVFVWYTTWQLDVWHGTGYALFVSRQYDTTALRTPDGLGLSHIFYLILD
jgi:hypothetical protein